MFFPTHLDVVLNHKLSSIPLMWLRHHIQWLLHVHLEIFVEPMRLKYHLKWLINPSSIFSLIKRWPTTISDLSSRLHLPNFPIWPHQLSHMTSSTFKTKFNLSSSYMLSLRREALYSPVWRRSCNIMYCSVTFFM